MEDGRRWRTSGHDPPQPQCLSSRTPGTLGSSWTALALLPLADAPDLGGNGFRISENMTFFQEISIVFLIRSLSKECSSLYKINTVLYFYSLLATKKERYCVFCNSDGFNFA